MISGAGNAPGIVIKGKEYPHPNRKTAGMIFSAAAAPLAAEALAQA